MYLTLLCMSGFIFAGLNKEKFTREAKRAVVLCFRPEGKLTEVIPPQLNKKLIGFDPWLYRLTA